MCKATGSISGNADGGAIYGEITASSTMQKMINLLKAHTAFNANSHFIDIGSRLGKPNLHVDQDPGVGFSFGIEIKRIRWMLSLHYFNRVLKFSLQQSQLDKMEQKNLIGYNCFFMNRDVTDCYHMLAYFANISLLTRAHLALYINITPYIVVHLGMTLEMT